MSTVSGKNNLSSVLFGKTRRAILALLYGHTDEESYLRQIAKATGAGLGAVQREIGQLSEVGIIRRSVRGQNVYFQANRESPVFNELKGLVIKTVGIGDVLRTALTSLTDRLQIAFVYGSVARGDERQTSDLDILVVGKVTFAEVVSALGQAQKTINREINPTVYPSGEFKSKLLEGHHFLNTTLRKPLLFLIGDERELAKMGKKTAGSLNIGSRKGGNILSREEILKQLRDHKDELRSRFSVRQIGLFGSYVRGEANEGSDIDLLVEFEETTFDHYMDLKFFLEKVFQHPLDLVLAESVKPRLKPLITQQVTYA